MTAYMGARHDGGKTGSVRNRESAYLRAKPSLPAIQ